METLGAAAVRGPTTVALVFLGQARPSPVTSLPEGAVWAAGYRRGGGVVLLPAAVVGDRVTAGRRAGKRATALRSFGGTG